MKSLRRARQSSRTFHVTRSTPPAANPWNLAAAAAPGSKSTTTGSNASGEAGRTWITSPVSPDATAVSVVAFSISTSCRRETVSAAVVGAANTPASHSAPPAGVGCTARKRSTSASWWRTSSRARYPAGRSVWVNAMHAAASGWSFRRGGHRFDDGVEVCGARRAPRLEVGIFFLRGADHPYQLTGQSRELIGRVRRRHLEEQRGDTAIQSLAAKVGRRLAPQTLADAHDPREHRHPQLEGYHRLLNFRQRICRIVSPRGQAGELVREATSIGRQPRRQFIVQIGRAPADIPAQLVEPHLQPLPSPQIWQGGSDPVREQATSDQQQQEDEGIDDGLRGLAVEASRDVDHVIGATRAGAAVIQTRGRLGYSQHPSPLLRLEQAGAQPAGRRREGARHIDGPVRADLL